MNDDFERRLRQQPFRAPPPELREAIFGRAENPANVIEPARWTWRDWFWPAPQAWGALAALWLLFAALTWSEDRPALPTPALAAPSAVESSTLVALHHFRELHHAINNLN